MRIGLISGVHANLPALEAVLEHLRAASVDTVVCAGDVVGRGPHPDACVEVLAEHRIPCVAGDHDRAAVGGPDLDAADVVTRRSLAWTRATIAPPTAAYLAALPATYALGPVLVGHRGGVHPDPARAFAGGGHEVVVLGGAQRPSSSSEWERARRPSRREADLPPGRVLIELGATGCSDGWVPRARCAVLDLGADRIAFPALPYDSARTLRDLARIGVPTSAVHDPPRLARLLPSRRRPLTPAEPASCGGSRR